MKRVAAFVILSALAVGCSPVPPQSDAVMCDVATRLVTARTLTQQAALRDADGDKDEARQMAGQARSLAQEANDQLQTVSSDNVRQGGTWQALLEAYLHVGQAANALLPDYANTYGMTGDELTAANSYLQIAEAGLPARCFTVSPSPRAGASEP